MARKTIIVGIYLIENLVNNKKYVGQSKNILARWSGHRCDSKTKDLPLYRAMRKYGLENFKFSILEECSISELANKEDYWMHYYDCFIPKGYNYNIAETHFTNLAIPEKYRKIIADIKYSDKLLKDIAAENGLQKDAITMINRGKSWRVEGETYPLRGHDEIPLDWIVALIKDNYTIGEIADYFETTSPTIKGILYTNGLRVKDLREPLSSSRRIKLTNLSTNESWSFRKKLDAAEWMHNNVNSNATAQSHLSTLTYHLKNGKPYMGYQIEYDDITEKASDLK